MTITNFTEFNLPRNAYAAFDAVSMKQLITNRIKASGLFPDIDFTGSNISGLTDIVAYMYHVLLFYLNQTASETMFTQTELYENINKLVALIGYKPQGYHTSVVGVDMTALAALPIGPYTIRRFNYVYIGNNAYSFNDDVTFEKTLSGDQVIESVSRTQSMQQGIFREYPIYTAIGESFEQFTISIATPDNTTNTKYVDNNNIFVFVKEANAQKWYEWKEVSSLYVAEPTSRVYDVRFNEDGRYELKFGNNITGKRLNVGDLVAVYYLQSDGDQGVASVGAMQGKALVQFTTTQWESIFNDIRNPDLVFMSPDQLQYINLNNTQVSTNFNVPETTSQIRENAPSIFSAQNRLVTTGDYVSHVNKYFNYLISDVQVVSNQRYTSEYQKYFFDIGLERPNDNQQVLLNQITFMDACDFNNVYVFVVPKVGAITNGVTPNSLNISMKQAIVDKLEPLKLVNQNIVVCDPVYQAFSFGLNYSGEDSSIDIKDETMLLVHRSPDFLVSKEQLRSKVVDVIKSFFALSNNRLGDIVNLTQLNINIMSIPGVARVETQRNDGSTIRVVPKINMIVWNPMYPEVLSNITSQNIQMKFFEFPFFYDVDNIINKIQIL